MLTYEILKSKETLIGFIIFAVIVISIGIVISIKERSKQ